MNILDLAESHLRKLLQVGIRFVWLGSGKAIKMVIDNLTLRTAQKHVKNFGDETSGLLAEHRQALDCLECEAFLQLGIDAFHWVMRADQAFRESIADGKLEFQEQIEDALRLLCRAWLNPCALAEPWIAQQQGQGYELDNLAEFRHCRTEMQAIVDSFQETGPAELPAAMARMQDQALSEHANGETAEFV